jgi:hypothetical protein
MPTDPETPPPQRAEDARIARILERYEAEHPVAADEEPQLARQVKEALDTLTAGDAAPLPPRPEQTRREVSETGAGIRRWQRLVLAAVAVALIVLFWHRLVWIG